MRRFFALTAVLFALAPVVAQGQVRVGRDSSTRLNRFGRDLVYGTGMGLLYAEVDQMRNEPPQWGKGWDGYGKRAASNVGEFAIQEGVTDGLAAVLHRPLDYQRCPCHGFDDRMAWAIRQSLTDVMPHDQHPLAVPRIVGAYAGSFAQASWRPAASSSRARVAVLNGTVSLLIGAGINVFHEFKR